MASLAYVSCEVSAGIFSSERVARVRGVNGACEAIVDEQDVIVSSPAELPTSGQVRVAILRRNGKSVLVELPRETFQGGRRIEVDSALVHSCE